MSENVKTLQFPLLRSRQTSQILQVSTTYPLRVAYMNRLSVLEHYAAQNPPIQLRTDTTLTLIPSKCENTKSEKHGAEHQTFLTLWPTPV